MPPKQVIWTVLPNGVHKQDAKTFLRISVFVSLKLGEHKEKYKLDAFPEFLSWPSLLKPAEFQVEFSNGNSGFTVNAAANKAILSEELWADLFKATTPVIGCLAKVQSAPIIHSFSLKESAAFVKDTYRATTATSLNQLPTTHQVTTGGAEPGHFTSILRNVEAAATIRPDKQQALGQVFAGMQPGQPRTMPRAVSQNVAAAGFSSREELNFHRINHFFQSTAPETPPSAPKTPPPPPSVPEIDFHKMLSLLGDAPELMRRLGVVLDLEIELTETLASQLANLLTNLPDPRGRGEVISPAFRLILREQDFPQDRFNNGRPLTRFSLQGDRFFALPEPDGEIVDGMLDLRGVDDRADPNAPEKYQLVQIDEDEAALKLSTLGQYLASMLELETDKAKHEDLEQQQREASLPALRTSGIALVRDKRDQKVSRQLGKAGEAQEKLNGNRRGEIIFDADDLLRGYRVDVFDEKAGKWFSLCQREGTYFILGDDKKPKLPDGLEFPADEGYAKSSTATSKAADANELYVHEALFEWDGWSLCAPRPGRTIRAEIVEETHENKVIKRQIEVVKKKSEIVEEWRKEEKKQFPLELAFRAKKGSLPRLRFGRSYRLRVRTVDLAGNSLPFNSDLIDNTRATEPLFYARFEPVTPPAMLLCDQITEGESLEHVVIRSNYNQKAEDYAKQHAQHNYLPDDQRHIVPPKTSQLMAEMHGMFDEYFAPDKYTVGFNIAKKEERTLFNINGVRIITPPGTQEPHPKSLPLKEGETLAAGQYLIYPRTTMDEPYLPDVFARGVAFEGLPGVTAIGKIDGLDVVSPDDNDFELKVPFAVPVPDTVKWPDNVKPFRLQVVEPPDISESDYCSDNSAPELMAPKWDAANRVLTVFLPKAEMIRVWYSCYLDKADVEQMGMYKWADEAQKRTFRRHAEAGSNWMTTPWRELVLVHAVQQPLCAPVFEKLGAAKGPDNTFAVLEGNCKYSPKSTSKLEILADWSEWIDDLTDEGPKRIDGKALLADAQISPLHIDGQPVASTLRRNITARHDFGDTKFRLVNYHLRAATGFREYFSPEITKDLQNVSREGAAFPGDHVQRFDLPDNPGAHVLANQPGGQPGGVVVLNSAPPAAPKVVYVVPTFGWERSQAGDTFTSKRLGGGLRVYLERPWFSSGDGELLGVIFAGPQRQMSKDALDELFNRLKPYMTQVGKDPIFDSEDPFPSLQAENFTAAVYSQIGVSLEEAENSRAAVAGHKVEYDENRKLWFSDIVIDAGPSYYPFARLALARYQPNSILGVEVSRVVMTDFVQLAPDRTLTVIFSEDKKSLMVNLAGFQARATYASRNAPQGSFEVLNPIEVSVEMRDTSVETDLNWFPAPNAVIERQSPSEVRGVASILGMVTDLNWFPAPNAVIERQSPSAVRGEAPILWMGKVTLPPSVPSTQYRLVVKEFEVYCEDKPDPNEPWKVNAPDPNDFWKDKRPAKRLVYADIVEL